MHWGWGCKKRRNSWSWNVLCASYKEFWCYSDRWEAIKFFLVQKYLICTKVQLLKWVAAILNPSDLLYLFQWGKTQYVFVTQCTQDTVQCQVLLVFSSIFIIMFSALSLHLIFLEPERMLLMVYDLFYKMFRLAFIAQRYLRFWILELEGREGRSGGQRHRHVFLIIAVTDLVLSRVDLIHWITSVFNPEATPRFLWGSPRSRCRKSNERIGGTSRYLTCVLVQEWFVI